MDITTLELTKQLIACKSVFPDDAGCLDLLIPIEGSPPSLLNPPPGCPFNPRCKYRFEACDKQTPKLEQLPGGHRDSCFLSAERKQAEWRDEISGEIVR